ncbi:MAG: SGNH/GDSL hydrolase family protein [Planctomycetota bacterium]
MRRKILFSAITFALFFGSFEILLRLSGFEMNVGVERMEFTFPLDDYNTNPRQPFLVRDEQLFWRPRPGAMEHNSRGFYGPEFQVDKKPGVFRIVCMGDSCTHFGPNSYPDLLRIYLDEIAPGKFEVINAAVIGYTSFQGRRLFESEVLKWSPDLVTVYYGWNDHWLARGLQDKEQSASSSSALDSLYGLRIVQLAAFLLGGIGNENTTFKRVEPDDYRDNLTQIGQQCESREIDVWYFTAPHAFDLGIPPYLATSGEVADVRTLIPLHQSYNQIVRKVAEKGDAELIDLESEMDGMSKLELFMEDNIHLSEGGRFYVTRRIIETLQATGVLEESPTP